MWAPESLKPNLSRVYVVFLGPEANSELIANMHVALRTSYAVLHKFNLGIFAKTQPSQSYQNFVIILASKLQTQPQCSTTSLRFILPAGYFPSRYRLHFLKLYLVSSLPLP
jgi:hypothetical protein